MNSPSLPQNAIENFLESLKLDRGVALKTLDAYRQDLKAFSLWLSQNSPSSEGWEFTVSRYFQTLTQRGFEPSSLARKQSTLRQFFAFLGIELESLPSIHLPKRLPKSLNSDEIEKLLAAAQSGLPYQGKAAAALQSRDSALLLMLYATGMRVSELCGLKLSSIEWQNSYARVLGKGGKERLCPFAEVAGAALRSYVEVSRPSLAPRDEALFLSARGEGLSRQSVWKVLKNLAAAAGIQTNLTPHRLRHAFATHLYESGMNLRSLQMLLGHSDLSTTQIYSHVSPEHLQAVHKKFHPRGGG